MLLCGSGCKAQDKLTAAAKPLAYFTEATQCSLVSGKDVELLIRYNNCAMQQRCGLN